MLYRLIQNPVDKVERKDLGLFDSPAGAKVRIQNEGFSILYEEEDSSHPGCWDIAATKPGAEITINGRRRRLEGASTLDLFAIEKED